MCMCVCVYFVFVYSLLVIFLILHNFTNLLNQLSCGVKGDGFWIYLNRCGVHGHDCVVLSTGLFVPSSNKHIRKIVAI